MIEVGPMPTPSTEEPERFPGGPDALDDQERYGDIPDTPMGADLPPREHPAAAEEPEEITQPDDKQQEPSEDAQPGVTSDSDAGEPEPPA